MLLSWDGIIKIFFKNMAAFQYFTADQMSVVSPPQFKWQDSTFKRIFNT
jgi:hypothetical protein